jgi:flagellar motility protein MotE (MotC chaperone)
MKKFFLFFVVLALTISTNAQQNRQQRPPRPLMERGQRGENKEKIEMYKIQFITEKLSLTKSEAEQFWPVYEAHKNAMREIMDKRLNDEILVQEEILSARKKYKNELKPVLKSDERVNEALKIDREFLQKIRGEMMRRKGFQS